MKSKKPSIFRQVLFAAFCVISFALAAAVVAAVQQARRERNVERTELYLACPWTLALVLGWHFASLGSVVWNVITVSLRQRITPDRLLGRMNAAYRMLGWGTMPIGAALGGVVAEVWGLRPTFAVAALLHLPLLLGFLVVTEARIAEADTVSAA